MVRTLKKMKIKVGKRVLVDSEMDYEAEISLSLFMLKK